MANIQSLKPFQPGHDPRRNLNGRPKGSGNVATTIKRLLEKEVGTGPDKKKMMDLLIDRILHEAIVKGDRKMIRLIWEYMDGKPKRQKGPYSGPIPLPPGI